MYFYKYIRMVEYCPLNNRMYCAEFVWNSCYEKIILCTAWEMLVNYNSCPLLCLCFAKNCYEKLWIISLSVHNNTAIVLKIWGFPVLVWQLLPFHCYFGQFSRVFRLFLPESNEYSRYSAIAVDPAVSCNRNRPSLINFLIIRDFSK